MKLPEIDFSAINPMNEFEHHIIESAEVQNLIDGAEQYLAAQSEPKPSKFREYGMMIIGGMAKSGDAFGITPPPKSS